MMTLLLALALAAPPELGELPPQKLARGQCALFLWDRASRKRFAMWPVGGALLLAEAGTSRSLALVPGTATGNPAFGITPRARFEAGGESVALDLILEAAPGAASATVQDGILTRTLADGTAVVLPVAGIIGCG
ncbi:hypothetical protein GCM10007973_20810 [Polymorphobacter multimanifer]|uniref:Uncharacterized protein n=1 Tax=Polymorphobacter multimanifer TaxID=1070431 RepID=A0A841L559_9SPHN|nr:hypothetical protein [Polymorphobacter multimanifer]MBB6227550.1 hypothetical protein [Polymorphobacter multimanifer]GGI84113.1 hypothetical protein GCM10007973_20810 [Polymorphobacter multimanifer]